MFSFFHSLFFVLGKKKKEKKRKENKQS